MKELLTCINPDCSNYAELEIDLFEDKWDVEWGTRQNCDVCAPYFMEIGELRYKIEQLKLKQPKKEDPLSHLPNNSGAEGIIYRPKSDEYEAGEPHPSVPSGFIKEEEC